MAFFGVTVERIATVRNHPNADRLDICTLEDMAFQFITGRDQYSVGDSVLYFPVDSCLPFELMEKLSLVREKKQDGKVVLDENGKTVMEGALRGREKNRLKTIRLRGMISQGLVSSLKLIEDLSSEEWSTDKITEFLGVTKYEPPEDISKPEWLRPLPVELSMYDIEGAERNKAVMEVLMTIPVCVTEKMEGMNFSATYRPKTDEFYVSQRKDTIVPKDGGENHPFWKWVNSHRLREIMASVRPDDYNSMTFYGEFLGPGVQGNIYDLKGHTVLFYDIKVDDLFLPVMPKMKIFDALFDENLNTVPILFYNIPLGSLLEDKTIADFSNGVSKLNEKVRREGVVITPMAEQMDESIGRLILKQRSPEYLVESRL